jgi:hypothetical protein
MIRLRIRQTRMGEYPWESQIGCKRQIISTRASLGQLLRPLPDLPAAAFADDQAERLQDASELVIDPNSHIDQLVSDDQQRLALV